MSIISSKSYLSH